VEFKIVEKLQKIGEDILPSQLKYHNKRVLVSKEFTFHAAHHLHNYRGKCMNLHGHEYVVVVGISGFTDNRGLTLDFGDLKRIWKEQVEVYLDHRYLNETLPLMNTSAENMVYWIYKQFEKFLPQDYLGIRMEFIRLYETKTSYAEYTREYDLGEGE
jgi:6-pyruvoyltetrahydropterin/6-carboxytetrahydropterin synthase